MANRNVVAWVVGGAAILGGIGLIYYLTRPEPQQEEEEIVASISASESTTAPAAAKSVEAPAPAKAANGVPPGRDAVAVGSSSGSKSKRGGREAIDRDLLLQMLTTMIERITLLKGELEEKFAERFAESQGNFELARDRTQQDLADGVTQIEKEIQAQYGITQADMMQAQQSFSSDPEVLEAMMRLRSVFFGDEGAVDPDSITVPEGMTVDSFYEKFCQHVAIVDRTFVNAVEEARRSAPREDRMKYLEMLIMRQLRDVNEAAVQEIGLTGEEFQACLMKYQGDPRFSEKIMDSQRRQEELRLTMEKED